MAVAKMSKLRLIGLKNERNRIMNTLARSGRFEVIKAANDEKRIKDVSHLERVTAKQAKVAFAINFLSSVKSDVEMNNAEVKKLKAKGRDEVFHVELDFNPPKSPAVKQQIGYDDFYDVAAREYELLAACDAMEKISFEKLEIKSQFIKLESTIKSLRPYEHCPLAFSAAKETKNTFTLIAVGPVKKEDFDLPGVREQFPSAAGRLLVITALLKDREQVLLRLGEEGYTLCPFKQDAAAKTLIENCTEQKTALKSRALHQLKNATTYYKYIQPLKVLYDVLEVEIEKSKAELDFVKTKSAFVLEGWVPADDAENLVSEIRAKTDKLISYILEPEEDDVPPTLLKNPKLIKPYEDVTNLYSVPAYSETDPNAFMSVFFFLFFGFMIGDAGYGILLTVAALIITKTVKLDTGMKRMIFLVGMGGVSAIFWGLLFGGMFSVTGFPALWFNPLDEPMIMLGASLVLGVVQLLVGYGIMAAKLIKKKKVLDAIFDVGFIYLLFIGLGVLALGLLLGLGAAATYTGLGCMGGALLGILCTAGRKKPKFFGKVLGGFSGLYGIVNILSDVLSYIRLFGLGLASCAIGLAFNTLGGVFFAVPVVGYVIGIIILIPLHAFNLGIGVLGAYVHNSRLQYIEFYGKFYEGDGRLFTPLGSKTKYVRFA